METLRFLLITSYYPPNHVGGDAMHVKYLAELLAGSGHEVTVVCSESAAKRKGVFRGQSSPTPKETVVAVSSHMPRLEIGLAYVTNRDRKVSRTLQRIVRESKPDVVHHHNVAAIGWHGVRGSWKTLYTVHDYWAICQRGDLLKFGMALCISPDCIPCAIRSGIPPQLWRRRGGTVGQAFAPDIILAPSVFALTQLKKRMRGFRGDFVHCPNFVPDTTDREAPPMLGSRRNLLYVGALTKQKGIEALVQAAAAQPGVALDVVGTGPEQERLQRMVRQTGVGTRVRIHGRVTTEELRLFYRSARALVIPSIWPENAPLVALEALAASTPVLGARTGGLPEVLDQIDSRLCMNRDQLLQGLEHLDWLDPLQITCRRTWEAHYSPRSFQEKYLGILEEGTAC